VERYSQFVDNVVFQIEYYPFLDAVKSGTVDKCGQLPALPELAKSSALIFLFSCSLR
jgi:hypothetical protein